jgi:Ca2+-binding EF-hand superfamily protein
MGAQASADGAEEVPFDANLPKTWPIAQSYAVFDEYESGKYDMGVTKEDFAKIMMEAIKGLDGSLVHELYVVFDPDASGVVHMMELMSALCIEGRGSIEDKVDFLLKVYDFDRGGNMSYDELTILLNCVLVGIVKITGKGRLPEDTEMEMLTDEVFLEAYKGNSGTISKDEFQLWVKSLLVDTPNPEPAVILEKFGLQPRVEGEGDTAAEP